MAFLAALALAASACAISDEPAFISDEPAFATACEPECDDPAESACACDTGFTCQDDCSCDWDCDAAPLGVAMGAEGGGGSPDPDNGREGSPGADPPANGDGGDAGEGGDAGDAGEDGEDGDDGGDDGGDGDGDDEGPESGGEDVPGPLPQDEAEPVGCDPDEHHALGDPGQAERLTPGDPAPRHACAGVDDWYVADARTGHSLIFSISGASQPLALRLYGPDGGLVARNQTDSQGAATLTVSHPPEDGAWTLRARAEDDLTYDIAVSLEAAPE